MWLFVVGNKYDICLSDNLLIFLLYMIFYRCKVHLLLARFGLQKYHQLQTMDIVAQKVKKRRMMMIMTTTALKQTSTTIVMSKSRVSIRICVNYWNVKYSFWNRHIKFCLSYFTCFVIVSFSDGVVYNSLIYLLEQFLNVIYCNLW